MPRRKKSNLAYRRKGLSRKLKVQQPSTLQESQEEKIFAGIVVCHDADREIQESDWFWEVPSLAPCSSEETSHCIESEAFEYKEDSDGAKANKFFLILHCIYEYQPCQNVDTIAEALKPDFLEHLYAKLKTCELPSMWTLVINRKEYVSIVEISRLLPPAIQKTVIIYADRNIDVYVHDKKIMIDKQQKWWKFDFNLQISQNILFSVRQILRLIHKLTSGSVCCGNFEQNCIAIHENGIIQNVCKNSYVEGNFKQVTSDGTAYFKTVRSSKCYLLLYNNKLRCSECSKIRILMRMSDYKKRLLVSPAKMEGTSSTVPFRYLTSDQKTKRLKNLSQALKYEKQITAKLKKI